MLTPFLAVLSAVLFACLIVVFLAMRDAERDYLAEKAICERLRAENAALGRRYSLAELDPWPVVNGD